MRKFLAIATASAAFVAAAQSARAQVSDQQIRFDPRMVTVPRTPPPPADTAPGPQVPREAGAGNVSVDSSTFDMFAQMVRRFNSLERRMDELMQQNAGLAQQLTDARKEIDVVNDNMRAVVRDSSGRTLISLMGNTCTMTAELLGRMRSPDITAGMLVETTLESPAWEQYINKPC